MTLNEYIEMLQDLIAEGDAAGETEVVATDADTGETYSPVISVGTDKDGIRRVRV